MGEGGRRPGEGSSCLPALRRGGFLQQNESDILIELEQRALIRPSGTFSHATRGRRGKFGTPESRLTKFNTHHCFYRHFTSANQPSPDSPALGGAAARRARLGVKQLAASFSRKSK